MSPADAAKRSARHLEQASEARRVVDRDGLALVGIGYALLGLLESGQPPKMLVPEPARADRQVCAHCRLSSAVREPCLSLGPEVLLCPNCHAAVHRVSES